MPNHNEAPPKYLFGALMASKCEASLKVYYDHPEAIKALLVRYGGDLDVITTKINSSYLGLIAIMLKAGYHDLNVKFHLFEKFHSGRLEDAAKSACPKMFFHQWELPAK